jgi:low temperature requirement protein LtrA
VASEPERHIAQTADRASTKSVARPRRPVAPLELFYDLVFVFAITQVSHLLFNDLSWAGAVHATLALLIVWWAWDYTVWVTSEVDLEPIAVRLLVLAMMLASLAMAVAVPEAFGRYGLLFAGSYVAVKVGRLLFLRVAATRQASATGPGRGTRLLIWFIASGVLWLLGGVAEGQARIAFWIAALAIDMTGPLVMYWIPGRNRLPFALWHVELSHLAERFEIFILIALGETIALTGVTTTLLGFDAGRLAAFALAFISTACLYWLYFDGFPLFARQRLERGPNGIQLARDAYMFLHVVIVAGVILSAVGDGVVIEGPTDILSGAEVAVVCAGPALYLLGQVLFRLRMTGRISWIRLVGAVACALVSLTGTVVTALGLCLLLVGVLVTVIAAETVTGGGAPRSQPA